MLGGKTLEDVTSTISKPPLPNFIIVGPQKCATTWLYQCLYEHPDVLLPETDSVHYFDMNYHRGEDWYRKYFEKYDGESLVGEETPTYIREQRAPERIAETLPNVKLIFTLRNPMDRAFSHYWHEKSKDKISFEFEDVFENYDLFQNWIVPGFYHRHLTRYEQHFPDEQIKVLFFDDLVEDDHAYLRDVYSFLSLDDYTPSVLDEKVNQGKFRGLNKQWVYNKSTSLFKRYAPEPAVDAVRPLHTRTRELLTSKNEYERGMAENTRERLESVFADEMRSLSDYTGRDLDHWFSFRSL